MLHLTMHWLSRPPALATQAAMDCARPRPERPFLASEQGRGPEQDGGTSTTELPGSQPSSRLMVSQVCHFCASVSPFTNKDNASPLC